MWITKKALLLHPLSERDAPPRKSDETEKSYEQKLFDILEYNATRKGKASQFRVMIERLIIAKEKRSDRAKDIKRTK